MSASSFISDVHKFICLRHRAMSGTSNLEHYQQHSVVCIVLMSFENMLIMQQFKRSLIKSCYLHIRSISEHSV